MTAQDRSPAPASHGIRTAFRSLSTPLRWTLTALSRPFDSGSAGIGWRTTVEQVVKDLEGLNRSTERDFLAVGEKLIEFRLAARRVASDMAALTELISGVQGRNASHALTRMLEHSLAIDARIEQSGQALGQAHDLSCRIRQAFSGLHNTVSVFRALCTLTQIETSRLGSTGADFGDLAAEVRPLSESIQSSVEGVLEVSSRLDQGIQTAMRSGTELRARQLKELPALIAAVIDSLQSLDERRQRAVELSACQAAQYEAVCGAVDDVVKSVQFHDITRQQIEHVAQALGQLRSAGESGRGSRSSYPPAARAVLALQIRRAARSDIKEHVGG